MSVRFIVHRLFYTEAIKNKEGLGMKGYYTQNGYWGLVDGRYILFATEADFREFMED